MFKKWTFGWLQQNQEEEKELRIKPETRNAAIEETTPVDEEILVECSSCK